MVEQGKCCNEYFYFSGRDICVGSLAFDNSTLYLDNIFARKGFRFLEYCFVSAFLIKNKLGDTVAVA